jgi:hypothetical protein
MQKDNFMHSSPRDIYLYVQTIHLSSDAKPFNNVIYPRVSNETTLWSPSSTSLCSIQWVNNSSQTNTRKQTQFSSDWRTISELWVDSNKSRVTSPHFTSSVRLTNSIQKAFNSLSPRPFSSELFEANNTSLHASNQHCWPPSTTSTTS